MATKGGPNIITDGLILALDAANTKSYPGSGTTWFELSGNGNNGVLSGGPTFSNGTISFDGTNDFVTISNDGTKFDSWRTGQTVTIWMNHTFISGRKNPWDQAYGGTSTWTHEQGANINGYYGTAGSNTTPYTSTNSGTTPTGVWNCMTRTHDTSTVRWFKNDINTQTSGNSYGTLGDTNANVRIGLGYADYWIGQMGIVMAYSRALTPEEITQNYNALKSRFELS